MTEELISVIVPVYNVEEYLRRCIDSILNQTYHDIEIILIDDGSTDNSGKICDEYALKDNRIRVIHKENGGLSDARNVGLNSMKGKYVTFVDSDDYVEEFYIKYLYELLEKYNTKMSIASYTVTTNSKQINMKDGYNETVLNTEECLDRMLCEQGFTISSCAKMYLKDLFNNVRFPKGKLCEDNATTYKLVMQCEKIAYGNKSIYNYYKRENSIMTSKFNLKKIDLIELTDEMCNEIDKRFPKLKDATNKKRIASRFSILRQMLVVQLDKEEQKVEKEIERYIKDRKSQIFKNCKVDVREKIALISLMLGKKCFSFSWKVYTKFKY